MLTHIKENIDFLRQKPRQISKSPYLYIHIYIYIMYIYICIYYILYISSIFCLISKSKSSFGQTLVKIKRIVKRMVKFAKIWYKYNSSHVHSFLSTTKHLGKIRPHMIVIVLFNSLKRLCEQTNLTVLEKDQIFFIPTASKNINPIQDGLLQGCSWMGGVVAKRQPPA